MRRVDRSVVLAFVVLFAGCGSSAAVDAASPSAAATPASQSVPDVTASPTPSTSAAPLTVDAPSPTPTAVAPGVNACRILTDDDFAVLDVVGELTRDQAGEFCWYDLERDGEKVGELYVEYDPTEFFNTYDRLSESLDQLGVVDSQVVDGPWDAGLYFSEDRQNALHVITERGEEDWHVILLGDIVDNPIQPGQFVDELTTLTRTLHAAVPFEDPS